MKALFRLITVAVLLVVLVELPSLLIAAGRDAKLPEQLEDSANEKFSKSISNHDKMTRKDVFVIQPSHIDYPIAPHFPIKYK